MAAVGHRAAVGPAGSRGPSSPATSVHDTQAQVNGTQTGPAKAKKGKGKKAVDPSETGKLLAAKINQLELNAAGEKEEEQEIGTHSVALAQSARATALRADEG